MANPNGASDVSTPEQALAHMDQTERAEQTQSKKLAQNDPKTPLGYTSLGKATDPRKQKE